jgi:glycosyl hydrolase family 44
VICSKMPVTENPVCPSTCMPYRTSQYNTQLRFVLSVLTLTLALPIVAAASATAAYVGADTTTQGNWTDTYGLDGQLIPNDLSNAPSYATVSFTGSSPYTWAASSTDPRAVQTAAFSSSRIASTYFSKGFTINLNLTDGNTHQISLYLCDWDHGSRVETISIVDAVSKVVLSTQTFSVFTGGVYEKWNVSGNVQIEVIYNSGSNAIVNAVFFDTAGAATTATATYTGADSTTLGTWTGHYGADGLSIASDLTSTPTYAQLDLAGDQPYVWVASTTDPRALQTAGGSSSRIASTYFAKSFDIDLNLTDGKTHKISLYLCDWDHGSRVETISIVDAKSKALLSKESVSAFSGGIYEAWNISGSVQIQVVDNSGANAIVNAIFFDTGATVIPPPPPPIPTGLAATGGNARVSLSWSASSAATGYHVKRSTTNGSGYTQIAAPTSTTYADTTVSNGTPYYYVVSAFNASAESGNSTQASATPSANSTSVLVTVDVLTNRHPISPYVYGGAYPNNAAQITDSGLSVVRWGGDATSTYNWQAQTYNAAADYYFEDYAASGFSNSSADSDSIQFIKDVKAAGGNPLMTMVMLPWVAKSAETPPPNANDHWSFSVAKYGAQCSTDYWNSDAGNGIAYSANCASQPTYLTANPNDAYVPLLDNHGDTCTLGTGCVYRSDWAAALATAFGSAPHFYDMDNEIEIWGSTHRDIHPTPSAYEELRDTYIAEARALKGWDPQAIRLGPITCCWWFYWNGANNNDKGAHAGLDFLPWWLNEVYWQDQIAGTQSVDVFDVHAYPDAPGESTLAQQQALAARIYRDYWDPTYVSESGDINQPWTTNIQPNKTIPFRIPRLRAIANMIYPGLPLSITEWSAEIAGAADFSTALGDADAYGILGRERVYLASRWVAPTPTNPNYQALKLFTNYDGQHHGFAPISVSATNNGDPNLFSSYAAVNAGGTTVTLLFLNKDPKNTAQTQFAFNGFTPSQVTTYTLSQATPTSIVASSPQSWTSNLSFAPYTLTLLVITGTTTKVPAAEWDLNPDTIMVPANGTVTLSPKITSGSVPVTLGTPQSDTGISVAVTADTVTSSQNGSITVTAGSNPGFYHYSVPGTDSSTKTNQGGWIVVGNPAATFTTTGNGQTGTAGTVLANPLIVTLAAGSSGASDAGGSVLFSTDSGTLSNGTASGSKVIAVTNSSGIASVTLTLPGSARTVHVTAEGPYGLGHPIATFTETAQ